MALWIHQSIRGACHCCRIRAWKAWMGKDGAGYRAVLYTCVAAHWVTLLAAVAVAGTLPVTPLALLGACHILSTPRLPMHAWTASDSYCMVS